MSAANAKNPKSVFLFGGTTEGRLLAGWMKEHDIPFTLSVATAFGRMMSEPALPPDRIRQGRLTEAEMAPLLAAAALVIDATHPYAAAATQNIKAACADAGVEYLRVLRPSSPLPGAAPRSRHFADMTALVDYLNTTSGPVLFTTGSRDAALWTKLHDFTSRVWLRILPMAEALEHCLALGYPAHHILCMQGPFTTKMNETALRLTKANFLVTKDSGDIGGFTQKLEAAAHMNTEVLILGRPADDEAALTLEQTAAFLCDRYALPPHAAWPGASFEIENKNHQDKITPRFPLFIDLRNRPVIVIGGGPIATRRIHTLLDFGAHITLVAPAATPELQVLAQEGRLTFHRRAYIPGDLAAVPYRLALAATNKAETNAAVADEADALAIPCSVADDRQKGTFWFPAVVTGPDFVAGITSADGSNHHKLKALAARLRQEETGI